MEQSLRGSSHDSRIGFFASGALLLALVFSALVVISLGHFRYALFQGNNELFVNELFHALAGRPYYTDYVVAYGHRAIEAGLPRIPTTLIDHLSLLHVPALLPFFLVLPYWTAIPVGYATINILGSLWGLHRMLRATGGITTWLACLLPLALFFSPFNAPSGHNVLLNKGYPEALALPLGILLFAAVVGKRNKAIIVWSLTLLLVKENLSPMVLLVGLYVARYLDRRTGLAVITAAVLAFVAAFFVVPLALGVTPHLFVIAGGHLEIGNILGVGSHLVLVVWCLTVAAGMSYAAIRSTTRSDEKALLWLLVVVFLGHFASMVVIRFHLHHAGIPLACFLTFVCLTASFWKRELRRWRFGLLAGIAFCGMTILVPTYKFGEALLTADWKRADLVFETIEVQRLVPEEAGILHDAPVSLEGLLAFRPRSVRAGIESEIGCFEYLVSFDSRHPLWQRYIATVPSTHKFRKWMDESRAAIASELDSGMWRKVQGTRHYRVFENLRGCRDAAS